MTLSFKNFGRIGSRGIPHVRYSRMGLDFVGLLSLTMVTMWVAGCTDPRLGSLKAPPSRNVYQPDDQKPSSSTVPGSRPAPFK